MFNPPFDAWVLLFARNKEESGGADFRSVLSDLSCHSLARLVGFSDVLAQFAGSIRACQEILCKLRR